MKPAAPLWRAFTGALVVAACALPLALLQDKSVTLDEVAHIAAGYSYLRTGEIVLNPMHPPLVKELAALPLLTIDPRLPVDRELIHRLGQDIYFQWRFGTDYLRFLGAEHVLHKARPVATLLSALLALLIAAWSTSLWGPAGGALSTLLYVLDPTITAHAQLVTTDVPFALSAVLFLYVLRRTVRRPTWIGIVASGAALGLALGTKFSAVVLLPVAVVLLTIASIADAPEAGPRATTPPLGLLYSSRPFDRLLGSAGAFGLVVSIAIFVLWSIYLFPSNAAFYAHGVSLVEVDHAASYLHLFRGELSTGTWPSYFLVAWLVKTPIPELALIALAALAFARGTRGSLVDEAFLLVPLLFLFAGYSQLANPIGVRYVIPCYPFLFVFAGRLGSWLARPGLAGAAVVGLLVWCAVEFVAIWPDHLPYFNQVAGGWRGGVHWLDDSSVDWGENVQALRRYADERSLRDFTVCTVGNVDPGLFLPITAREVWVDRLVPPPSGIVILSSHCVARLDAWLKDRPENWLRRIEPISFIGHTYWVFAIPPLSERR